MFVQPVQRGRIIFQRHAGFSHRRGAVFADKLRVLAGYLRQNRARHALCLSRRILLDRCRLGPRKQRNRIDPVPDRRRMQPVPATVSVQGFLQKLAGGRAVDYVSALQKTVLIDSAQIAEELLQSPPRESRIVAQNLQARQRLVVESSFEKHLRMQAARIRRPVGARRYRAGEQFRHVEPTAPHGGPNQPEGGCLIYRHARVGERRDDLPGGMPSGQSIAALDRLPQQLPHLVKVVHGHATPSILARLVRSSLPWRYLLMLCRQFPQLSSRISSMTGAPPRRKSLARHGSKPAITSSGS